jgi:nucleotide-binding universal stress UspA family protein
VFIIYVIEVKRALPLDAESDEAVLRGDEALEGAEQVATKAGLSVTAELLQAREVGPAIVDEAVQRKADLIILGTPYKKKFGEFDTGKTIPYVLRYAPCQVWVMREPVTPEVITK